MFGIGNGATGVFISYGKSILGQSEDAVAINCSEISSFGSNYRLVSGSFMFRFIV